MTVQPESESEEREIHETVTVKKVSRRPKAFRHPDAYDHYYRATRGERDALLGLAQRSAFRWKVYWQSEQRSGSFFISGTREEALSQATKTCWTQSIYRSGPVII